MSAEQHVLDELEKIYSPENLEKDTFFREMTEQNPEGWITLRKFSCISRFRKLVNGDVNVFIRAVDPSETFEISEDQTMLRKIPQSGTAHEEAMVPVAAPAVSEKDVNYFALQNKRSIYAKGFSVDPEPAVKDLQAFFEQYGRVLGIKLRREEDKTFKGSVFVQFESESIAQSVADKELEYDSCSLSMMTKSDYVDMKAKEKFDGVEWAPIKASIQSQYIEFSGADNLDFKEIRALVLKHADAGSIEMLQEPGCGVIHLRESTPEAFLAATQGKIEGLTFRLPSVDACFLAKSKQKERAMRHGRGRGGRGGRGGRRGGRGGGRGGGRDGGRGRGQKRTFPSESEKDDKTKRGKPDSIPPVVASAAHGTS